MIVYFLVMNSKKCSSWNQWSSNTTLSNLEKPGVNALKGRFINRGNKLKNYVPLHLNNKNMPSLNTHLC